MTHIFEKQQNFQGHYSYTTESCVCHCNKYLRKHMFLLYSINSNRAIANLVNKSVIFKKLVPLFFTQNSFKKLSIN